MQALFLKPGSPCLFCPTPTHSPNPSLPQEGDQPLRLPGQIPPCLPLAPISDLHVHSWQELPGPWVRDPHPPSHHHFTCQWQFVLQKTRRGCLELASAASQLCTWPEGSCLPGAARRSGHPSGQSQPLSSPRISSVPLAPGRCGPRAGRRHWTHKLPPQISQGELWFSQSRSSYFPCCHPSSRLPSVKLFMSLHSVSIYRKLPDHHRH